MTHGRRFGLMAIAGLFAAGAMFSTASAQEGPNTGAISLSASLDWTNEYWFRGIPQEDQGFIIQPGFEVSVALYSADEFSVDAYIGSWNSLHFEAPTGNGNPGSAAGAWYEADWYGGLSFGLPMNLWASVQYQTLFSPEGGANFADEVDITVGYNDVELWGDTGIPGWTGLQPYAMVAIETDAGSDFAAPAAFQETGIYLELGIAPGFTLVESEDYPISLTIPVTLGLGLDEYYQHDNLNTAPIEDEDETFGFVQIGAVASMPLSAIPAEFGSWSVKAGVSLLVTNEDFVENTVNAPSYAPGYDTVRVIGTVGIGMEY